MANVSRPTFVHDCTACIFLGSTTTEDGSVDLYVHPGPWMPTYVARTASEGSSYISGRYLVGRDPAITEAHRLAELRGIAI